MSGRPYDQMIQPGPCALCGAMNYPLSYGGPTICPPCDCSPPSPRQLRHLREEITRLKDELEYHKPRSVQVEEKLARQSSALHLAEEALAQGEPWSLRESILRMSNAVAHLLNEHGCDTHGHEGYKYARDAALATLPKIEAALAAIRGLAEGK